MQATDHLNRFIADLEGFSWRESGTAGRFHLTSGIWKDGAWLHEVVLVRPAQMKPETALLYITGGSVNDTDLAEAQAIADRSGLAVAMLFDIPNQPLFEMWEDDLIAHTFERYIETGDPTWPLLFPMARAAIRALDLLSGVGFRYFVVTGASKRGWTTWLAGATGDPRIVGIAPMVIDNLDFPAQMAHQLASWGTYSEQIEDYTSRELQDSMNSEFGAHLTTMMDPINYIDRIKCPILIINGSNDRYWTVDALSIYWDRLPPSTRCLIVPNVGHVLGDKEKMIETLGAFADACSSRGLLPLLSVRETPTIEVLAPLAGEIHIWAAPSETLDFRDSTWSVVASGEGELLHSHVRALLDRVGSTGTRINTAVIVEARFAGPTGSYSLSLPARILPKGLLAGS